MGLVEDAVIIHFFFLFIPNQCRMGGNFMSYSTLLEGHVFFLMPCSMTVLSLFFLWNCFVPGKMSRLYEKIM